ncbi:MAG TPA: RNA 2',3'-cyclic phosphodiesterase [Gemmatimonadales bacterium]|nr:RNA 2',3'-cyclic phosphodiesterase [Gemmatimonadales bacterium]
MRLFVAVNFPATLRERLWEATIPLRAMELPVRWVAASGMHLTLKFLGETGEARLDELGGALDQAVAGVRSMPVTVEGFGAFPDVTRPSVIWAGVVTDPALELLQHGVERAFGPLGFPPEGRPFRPHVTLGRTRRDAPREAFRDFEPALERLVWSETAEVTSIELMRSTTAKGRVVYEEVRHGRLS